MRCGAVGCEEGRGMHALTMGGVMGWGDDVAAMA